MPIRYKVVKKKSRKSAVINGNSHYALQYLEGTTVFALEDTLGIMTFTSKRSAEIFAYHFENPWIESERMSVIMVETIGKGSCPPLISRKVKSEGLDVFYNFPDGYDYNAQTPPDNTMCYPGVKVLE